MFNEKEFEVLRDLLEGKTVLEDKIVIDNLIRNGYLQKNLVITEKATEELQKYKVDNAIILAAGMSTRFVPVSYELPKGLISVKGEVLIERSIRQLKEAGVEEIVIVVGYMMEKFLYLREKYGVKIVVNNEYATKNTHSSIYAAKNYLRSTYICCSDNYYPENPFHAYEYKALYTSVFLSGTSYAEMALTFEEDGLIVGVNTPSCDQWIMFGHAYFDRPFSKAFLPILESYYGREEVANMYWENVYAENLDKLPMYIKQVEDGGILEFDSMEELKVFDPDFLKYNKIKIYENICGALNCEISDILNAKEVKKGPDYRLFSFSCKDKKYIYCHPTKKIEEFNVCNEQNSLEMISGIDKGIALVKDNEKEGWKILKYVDVA